VHYQVVCPPLAGSCPGASEKIRDPRRRPRARAGPRATAGPMNMARRQEPTSNLAFRRAK